MSDHKTPRLYPDGFYHMTPELRSKIWAATFGAVYATGRPTKDCARIADHAVIDAITFMDNLMEDHKNRE